MAVALAKELDEHNKNVRLFRKVQRETGQREVDGQRGDLMSKPDKISKPSGVVA